jgi:hypothetical protein
MRQIWSQLKLEPATPIMDVLRNGIARITIRHSDDGSSIAERNRHRVFNNVPYADLQPPKSILNIKIETVRFLMDVLEAKQRLHLKRSGTSSAERLVRSTQNEEAIKHIDELGALVKGVKPEDRDADLESAINHSLSHPSSLGRKRKRTLSAVNGLQSYGRLSTLLELQLTGINTLTDEQLADIQILVDVAMRLSICGVAKSSGGIKIKANTFGVGLADVAPVLWRPGYLAACKTGL